MTKLFVGRLPEGCTSKDLEDLFGKYGQVTECDVVGKFGFVHLSKREEAEECIKKLNKYSLMGSQLSVEYSTSRVHPEPGTAGRAKGAAKSMKKVDRGYQRDSVRHGFGPPSPTSDGYYSNYTNAYYSNDYRYDKDPYCDRDSYYSRERMRPYPSPYDRRPYYDDPYGRRSYPSPPSQPTPADNVYARRPPDNIYARDDRGRNDISTPMYSTRSPPYHSTSHSYPSQLSHPNSQRSSEAYWNYTYPNGDGMNRYERTPMDSSVSSSMSTRRTAY